MQRMRQNKLISMRHAAHAVSIYENWRRLSPEGNKPFTTFGHIEEQEVKCLTLFVR